MHLKSYLWACFGCLVVVWVFLPWGCFGGEGTTGLGWFFVWFLWRNQYAPAGWWGMALRLKPEAEASWERVLMTPMMLVFPSHTPNSTARSDSSAQAWHPGHCCLLSLRGKHGSPPQLSSPFLPKNCLVDSLLLTHTLSNNSNSRLRSLVHHRRTLHRVENGVWEKEWWEGLVSAGAVWCGTSLPLPQPAPGISPQLSPLLNFSFFIFK